MKEIRSKDLYLELGLKTEEISQEILIENYRILDVMQFATFHIFLNRVTIQNCHFEGLFSFEGNHFKDAVELKNCSFNSVRISASSFTSTFDFLHNVVHKEMEFWDSLFYDKVSFIKNDFLGGTNLFQKHDSYGCVDFKKGLMFY